MPVQRIVERPDDAIGVGDRSDLPDLIRAGDLLQLTVEANGVTL